MRKRRSPIAWAHPRSLYWWDSIVPDFSPHEFMQNFRVSRESFDYICDRLNDVIGRRNTNLRLSVPLRKRVAIAIWKLATGSEYRTISHLFGVGRSTVYNCVREFCDAVVMVLLPVHITMPDAAIGRTLIPRYFRSIFEGGATELYYVLKHPKESFHNNFVSLDCDQCTMVTQNGKPMFTQVCVEGRLYLEFMFDDMMRIKTWHFSIRQHRELIPRSILAMHAQDPQMLDQLSKNIMRCGLSNSTLNYLRLCVILEPMQELMSRHKTYSLSPRDCLKTCLFQKWQRMVAPPAEPARQAPNKRRKRKIQVPDVMVVGEPTLMGGEFGDEDERLITRLENTQFDAANGIDDEDSFNNSPALGANSPWNNKAPSSQESKGDNPTSQASE
ncbi:hypothetical protein NHX12_034139 [Muraenolepis orangiensis]|uniref:LIM interaction domain-containing protein n=1 Tax=Muraenolepis orangiensis TaxID=630683 RepID=A0A9Q0D7R6_9TELE|nr:hypothetical protein NHX12_034139 [Muraenolepis orangiensis]